MRFLSDILAKAGLIVDGAAVFNSTATGQTAASNDNSTKFATTAWVRTFVQPYTLPIASATILGGVKVGTGLAIDTITGVLSVSNGGVSIKASQTFTATAGQTIFTITGGYTPGLIDVFLNGIYLSPGQTVATNGTTVTLNDAASAGDIIDVIITSPISNGSVANTDNLPEGLTNLYYTSTRVRSAISLSTTGVSGAATYNILTGQLNIPNYQGLVPAGGIAGQILSKVDGTDYNTQWLDEAPAASYTSQLKHRVKSSQAITKGQAVYVSSADGTNMIISKASNVSEGTSSKTMGLLESTVSVNGTANVITEGLLAGLDTTGATAAGDPVWLGTDGNLIYGLVNKPVAPAHLVFIGVVTRRNANNGEIFVKVQNGFEFGELHDYVQNGVQDNYVISYESATSLYKPKSIATLLGYTPVTNARTITINGVAYDLSADRSWSIAAGVTSFNTRTGAITLTSGDVTGALTYTPVTNARTLTINGTAYDLSADRSWSIATSDATKLPLTGGTLTGALTIGSYDGQALKFQSATSTGSSYLRFYNSAGTSRGYLGLFWSGTADYMVYDSGALNMAFNSTGGFSFVGSTITSSGDLTFSNSAVIKSVGSSGYIATYANGGGLYWGGIASTNQMFLSSAGSLGIGTTSPSGGISGTEVALEISNTNVGVLAITSLAASGRKYQIYSSNDGSLYIRDGSLGIQRFNIQASGNVLIGTTSDNGLAKLQTAGSISFTTSAFTAILGTTSSSWSGTGSYPTIYSNTADQWMMHINPHISYTQNGVNGFTGSMLGATIRMASNPTATTYWDLGIGVNNVGADKFSIGRAGSSLVSLTNGGFMTVANEIRSNGLRLNISSNNQGHRIYSRTMDVSAYTSQTSMRFTVAGGNNVQFQYEITFHATRLSGTLAEIWYLRYTGGIAYDTAGNPNERWWDLREQAGNGIAGVGRNNNTGNLEITNSAFDTSCRLTVCVKITCNNWDAVTVSFS